MLEHRTPIFARNSSNSGKTYLFPSKQDFGYCHSTDVHHMDTYQAIQFVLRAKEQALASFAGKGQLFSFLQ